MRTGNDVGKTKRLKKIFSNSDGKVVIVPLDDSLISGPINGLETVKKKIELIVQDPPDGIIGFHGLFKLYGDILGTIPTILNVTASTTQSQHTRKVLVGSVRQAISLDVDAVAVHVNIGSKYESEMIQILGSIGQECDEYGIPILGILYPRSEDVDADNNFLELKRSKPKEYAKLVAHATRLGSELGVDIIKTQYTGTIDSFNSVVDICTSVPIIVAGGPVVEPEAMLQMAYDVIIAGGCGLSFGRNVFSRENPQPFVTALKAIVHQGAMPKDVLGLIR